MGPRASIEAADPIPLGIGYYTVPEAARLVGERPRNVRRWLGGDEGGAKRGSPPLWTPQLPRAGSHIELGFRDLIELRFVAAFLKAGLSLGTVRRCLDRARAVTGVERPLSTGRFHTDGRRIFLDSLKEGTTSSLDIGRDQFVFRSVVERTFKDLDLSGDDIARWRPYGGRPSVVVDPQRSFGQPIASAFGVPTVVLATSAEAEGSVERAAFLYDVPAGVVHDAIGFERQLRAA